MVLRQQLQPAIVSAHFSAQNAINYTECRKGGQ